MVHMGGMQVVRDSSGNVIDILSFPEHPEKGHLESPIYMEVDRQTDPKMLDQNQGKFILS